MHQIRPSNRGSANHRISEAVMETDSLSSSLQQLYHDMEIAVISIGDKVTGLGDCDLSPVL